MHSKGHIVFTYRNCANVFSNQHKQWSGIILRPWNVELLRTHKCYTPNYHMAVVRDLINPVSVR